MSPPLADFNVVLCVCVVWSMLQTDSDDAAKKRKIRISFSNSEQLSLVAKDKKNCSGIQELLQSYTDAAMERARAAAAAASADDDGW